MHFAALSNSLDTISLLVQLGHPLDMQDDRGWTALHQAIDYSFVDSTKLLVQYGHSIHVKNNNGYTPLDIAANYESLRLLQEACEPNIF